MKRKTIIMVTAAVVALAAGLGWYGYSNSNKNVNDLTETEEEEKASPVGPDFNADSAYAFTQAQCDFGPRDMNSKGHEECGAWIVAKFKGYGCKVTTQEADLKGYDGTTLKSTNIMAQYNPGATTRILLCAHWDSRPWADNDPDSANWHKPILAANDAASGVAVMLEIARLLQKNALPSGFGVDFVCFDAEDWGTPQWEANQDASGDSWALGAQHFAANLPQGYEARYGILLDMVGGMNAKFYKEGISNQYAPEIVKKVWRAARQAGFGSYFPRQEGGMITDDHIPLNQKAGIPTIDIIPYPGGDNVSFSRTWHTTNDTPENISIETLRAVGQTLLQVLATEGK